MKLRGLELLFILQATKCTCIRTIKMKQIFHRLIIILTQFQRLILLIYELAKICTIYFEGSARTTFKLNFIILN